MAGWTSLPTELLAEISGRLRGDADRIHIHQVCSHWGASTSRLAACRPWIVAGGEPWSLVGPVGEHSFWLPLGGRRIYLGTPAGLPYCCGTPLGWLALMDNLQSPTRFLLWEPLSEAEISLPCLPAVVQVFLSGDPLTSPDWLAITSQKLYTTGTCMGQTLFFWRPGDAAWTMQLGRPNGRIDSAAFHQGKFYFTDIGWTLHVYDLVSDRSPPKLVRSTNLYSAVRARHGFRQFPGGGRPTWYVVAFNGDLLLVVMYRAPNIKAVEVYRPDWAAERLELRDKVTDLGDYSLFLGRGDAFALCAKEFTL